MQRGKLKPEDEDCFQRHYVDVKENIDAVHLIDKLYSENVISIEDKETIGEVKRQSKRNEILLKAILHSGPGDNFKKFIDALRINYSHLKIVQERSNQFRAQEDSVESVAGVQPAKVDIESENKVKKYDITVLLVGQSGCGKSSTCETLMSFNKENVSLMQSLENKEKHTLQFNGRKIHFVDSPSIKHFRRDTQKLINEVQDSIDSVSEGFHAFLLIIKYQKVIKKEDLEVVKTLKSLYGPEILKNYCIFIVTNGDQLKADNTSFQDWSLGQEGEFKKLYEECGFRSVVIDNTTQDKEIIEDVLKNLIDEIDNLQFNGRRYTADHFMKAECGRRRMLLEEKRTIFEETCSKCIAILQSSGHIKDECTEENVNMLKNLYEESIQLIGAVEIMDEGTCILKVTIINGLQGVISGKLYVLNTKETEKKRMWETLEREEKKILKKIYKLMEKVKDEEEKLALKKEVMLLKQPISIPEQQKTDVKNEHQNIEQQLTEQSQIVKLQTKESSTQFSSNDFVETNRQVQDISFQILYFLYKLPKKVKALICLLWIASWILNILLHFITVQFEIELNTLNQIEQKYFALVDSTLNRV